jgi:hypothetical protein
MEEWKDVVGYEGAYQVSNAGQVRSVERLVGHVSGGALRKGRLLKQWLNNSGYPQVGLSNGNKVRNREVHRLVVDAFLGPAVEINHIDGNKQNNRLENLEKSSRSHNMRHSITQKGRGQKITIEQAREIRSQFHARRPRKAIAEQFGVSLGLVESIGSGKSWNWI